MNIAQKMVSPSPTVLHTMASENHHQSNSCVSNSSSNRQQCSSSINHHHAQHQDVVAKSPSLSSSRGNQSNLMANLASKTNITNQLQCNGTSGVSGSSGSLVGSRIQKDLEKFTRYFIVKAIQVIVQSRINSDGNINNYMRTECKPRGNDWFNLNIIDLKEVSDRTKSSLDNVFNENFSIRSNWKICCEISVGTNDDDSDGSGCGEKVILETWILNNKALVPATTTKILDARSNQSRIQLNSVNNSESLDNCRFYENGTTEDQTASSKILENNVANNVPKDTCDNNKVHVKSSVSCSSLSTAAASSTGMQNHRYGIGGSNTSITSSASATTSIYSIYNKMSLLLKTLMTTTRLTPAYLTTNRGCGQISSSSLPSNVPRVFYRIYGSKSSELPNQPDDYSSIDLRDFLPEKEFDQFSPLTRLGSVTNPLSELELVFSYRRDLRFCTTNTSKIANTRKECNSLAQRHRNLFDQECASAARQLLSTANQQQNNNHLDSHKNFIDDSHSNLNNCDCDREILDNVDGIMATSLTDFGQPLNAAFASPAVKINLDDEIATDNLRSLENAFEKLLSPISGAEFSPSKIQRGSSPKSLNSPSQQQEQPILKPIETTTLNATKPIQIPFSPRASASVGLSPTSLSSAATSNSLTDSYVFVDLNPPFASENQSDLNAFFHGPSPTFSSSYVTGSSSSVETTPAVTKDNVIQLSTQIAEIEANAELLDDFVDTICASSENGSDDDDDVSSDIYDHRIGGISGLGFNGGNQGFFKGSIPGMISGDGNCSQQLSN